MMEITRFFFSFKVNYVKSNCVLNKCVNYVLKCHFCTKDSFYFYLINSSFVIYFIVNRIVFFVA